MAMINPLSAILGASWKTSLAGYGTAGAIALGDYLAHTGTIDSAAMITAVGIAVLGRFSKDHNVSNSPSPLPESKPVEPPKS